MRLPLLGYPTLDPAPLAFEIDPIAPLLPLCSYCVDFRDSDFPLQPLTLLLHTDELGC